MFPSWRRQVCLLLYNKHNVSPRGKSWAELLVFIIKDSGSLNFGFLSCDANPPHCMLSNPLDHSASPLWHWEGKGNWWELETCAACCAVKCKVIWLQPKVHEVMAGLTCSMQVNLRSFTVLDSVLTSPSEPSPSPQCSMSNVIRSSRVQRTQWLLCIWEDLKKKN